MAAAVQRYPLITHWEPWNEPNLTSGYQGPFDMYFERILRPAAQAIRATCPSCLVVGPTLSDHVGSQTTWRIGEFLDLLGARSGGQYIDIVSFNHYKSSSLAALVDSWQQRYQALNRNGMTWQNIWITETGVKATSQYEQIVQSQYLLQMIHYMSESSRITNLFVYRLRDHVSAGDRMGVLFESTAPKRAYHTLKDVYLPTCQPAGFPWN